jgi:sugar lactone lactonase YvrE
MNPRAPYNSSGEFLNEMFHVRDLFDTKPVAVLVNNFQGRQFNSINDVAVNPRNGHLYFTDSLYGYLQDFRPPPALPTQVYRLDPDTGALTVVADEFDKPNGDTAYSWSL